MHIGVESLILLATVRVWRFLSPRRGRAPPLSGAVAGRSLTQQLESKFWNALCIAWFVFRRGGDDESPSLIAPP